MLLLVKPRIGRRWWVLATQLVALVIAVASPRLSVWRKSGALRAS
jgi:hypothetical protein